jgi:hypothetical protein
MPIETQRVKLPPFGLGVVIDRIQELIAVFAPIYRKRSDIEQHTAPPRYVWYPQDEEVTGARTPAAQAGAPRRLHDRIVTSEVHIWGRDSDEVEMMQAALFSCVRIVMRGQQYAPGKATWVPSGDNQLGVCLVQYLTLWIGMPEMVLPMTKRPAKDKPPTGSPADVGLEPQADSLPGDGNLDDGEP